MFDYLKLFLYELKHTYFSKKGDSNEINELAFILNYKSIRVVAKILNLQGVNNTLLTVLREPLVLNEVSSFEVCDGEFVDLKVDPKYLKEALLRNWKTGEFDLYLDANQTQIYTKEELCKLNKSRLNKLTVPLVSINDIRIYRNGYNFRFSPNFYCDDAYVSKMKTAKVDNVVQLRQNKRRG